MEEQNWNTISVDWYIGATQMLSTDEIIGFSEKLHLKHFTYISKHCLGKQENTC